VGDLVDARYGPILTINLIWKSWELTFLACIFIQNNINSTCPLENIARQEFEQKWRENTPLNPRHKTPTNLEQARGLKDPHDSLNELSIQGNTSPTNQNVSFSLPWIKGPTRACNRRRTAPSHPKPTLGTTCQPLDQSQWPKAVAGVRPNHWFSRTATGPPHLQLPCVDSWWTLEGSSARLHEIVGREPPGTPL
jgi:hypothetical protein